MRAGWIHGTKLHSFGSAEESKFVVMGKVYPTRTKNIFKMNKEIGMMLPKKELIQAE